MLRNLADAMGQPLALDDAPPFAPISAYAEETESATAERDPALNGLPMPAIDLADLASRKAEPQRFTIERIAPASEVTLFTGPGSGGKSLLGQQLATASAAAIGQCLGLDVQPGPAIYLTCEDSAEQLHWRQEHLCAAMSVNMASLAGKLHLVSLRGALDNELGTFTPEGALKLAPAYERLVAMIQATGSGLVFLDNVAHLYTGNENDRGQVTRFVNLLNRLAGETGAAIVLLGHPNKSGDSYSGSTAWLNAVRSQVTIDHERDGEGNILDPDARVLSVGKANYTRKGEAVRFRWHDWAYALKEDLPPDTAKEIAETIKINGENETFLACLRARQRMPGREVGPSTGPNYAPARFAEMTEAKGMAKPALARAMERLFYTGAITTKEIKRKGSDTKIVIVEALPNTSSEHLFRTGPNPRPNGSEHIPYT